MKIATWRNVALVLAMICAYQRWHSCTRSAAPAKPSAGDARLSGGSRPSSGSWSDSPEAPKLPSTEHREGAPATRTFFGFKVPARIAQLAPQPGETMRDYRDRMLPLAELAIAPQRARVARMRDDFAVLDAHQRAELDGAVQEAATAIQDRVIGAMANGELAPGAFKPMTGITMARELLDIVDRGNTRFVNSLTADQRTRLATHRFDFADYLLFSAHWEDALHVLD